MQCGMRRQQSIHISMLTYDFMWNDNKKIFPNELQMFGKHDWQTKLVDELTINYIS